MAKGWFEAPRLRTGFLALAVACGTALIHFQMPTQQRVGLELGDGFVPRPELARLSALGFDALLADYYWLQAVQIVGTSVSDPSRYAQVLGPLIDVVTTLDPWVDHAYRFAGVWLTDSVESVRLGNRLLERGIAYHPKEWRNRFLLGFNHFFYLEDNASAADVLEEAAALPAAPGYTRLLVARLRSDASGLETAAAFLQTLIEHEADPYARTQYQVALDEIETERRARFLDRAREEYRLRNGRDIRAVEDLLRVPRAVLKSLPSAHPILEGWRWVLHQETGQIVSSYYEDRYQLHIHSLDRQRRELWRPQLNPKGTGA